MESWWDCSKYIHRMWENISFTSAFRLVFKYSELVQEMQANSIIISNYDSLCHSIDPNVNKELSLNLLKSM